jgi:hypothetical protein
MSYTPLKVRYGTAVEPWHALSLFYHYDTPLPVIRDWTKSSRSLGQISPTTDMLIGVAPYIGAGFVAGAIAMHLAHRYRILGMNRRVRRNRRRRRMNPGWHLRYACRGD